jgi:hypothetical protein
MQQNVVFEVKNRVVAWYRPMGNATFALQSNCLAVRTVEDRPQCGGRGEGEAYAPHEC